MGHKAEIFTLTASVCFIDAMQIRQTFAPGRQDSNRYCDVFCRSTLAGTQKMLKHPLIYF